MEQQDDGSQTANSSTDGSGGTTTFSDTGADGYQSFWDIAERREMFYHYKNHTGDNGNPAMLHFKITPYVGLAYYDGTPDGKYDDQGNTIEDFNTVSPGMYPNIYDPTGNEIGNFVPARPFTLTGAGIPTYWGTVRLEVFSADHCHVIATNAQTNLYNPNGVFFDISTPLTPLYQPSTPQEEDLLSKYGKVFFYYWEALDQTTLAVVRSGYIMAECDTNVAAYWTNTPYTANLPAGGVANLYYNTGNPSYEIVLEGGTYPSVESFTYTVGGQTYTYTVELKTFLGGTNDPVSELKLTYN
ncbi:hypothetical protein [Paenimyroides viscosum]|uniref:Uncharacterized protein n=1 Tax=Paenimyroides viscosum TaxID=2488729 RepID=A0A3P1B4L9_9FLAO|nr:hypothetical protein [Paenimyroides viscosum]RRA96087.1 hypothetical protein EG242_04160 [Paenimyroides viscosum]